MTLLTQVQSSKKYPSEIRTDIKLSTIIKTCGSVKNSDFTPSIHLYIPITSQSGKWQESNRLAREIVFWRRVNIGVSLGILFHHLLVLQCCHQKINKCCNSTSLCQIIPFHQISSKGGGKRSKRSFER